MADKRISQLIERVDIANNDVLPIVASGATTTNKVTISTIQDWMQENLDVGVTSVGITLGSSGNDVNVTGSPITTSGNITINIPDASASARGLVTTGSQVFGGVKTFANGLSLPAVGGSNQITRIVNIGTLHEGTASLNQIGFNSGNNIYFGKGLNNGGVIQWNNAAVRYYTLPDADGTIALTSQLDGYVTLNTAQTITAQKTFTTSGSSDTMIISHGSGSGIALDVIKAGNSEALRVTKTSGSGNAVTITGGLLSAEAGQFSGDLQSSTRLIAATGGQQIIITPNLSGTTNRIETTGSLPLGIVSGGNITFAAGGTTPQITLATTGAVSLSNLAGTGTRMVVADSNGVLSSLSNPVTGTLATGQVAFGTAANTIGGSSNLIFDSTNINLGVGVATAASIDPTITSVVIRDAGSKVLDSKTGVLAFQTSDTSFTGTYADAVTAEIYSISENSAGSAFGIGFLTSTITGTNRAERWRITSAGILQSNGAQTIQTSSGALTLQPSNNVLIGTTTDAGFRLDVNGTARVQGALTTNLTQGSVPFIGASGLLSQDNTNLFWDNTNKRLGIGTTTTLSPLHVVGDIRSTGDIILAGGSGTPEVQFFQNSGNWKIAVDNDAMQFIDSTAASERWRITSTGVLQSNGAQTIQTSTGNLTLATAGGNGNIVLSPNGTGIVSVTGAATFSSSVTATGNVTISSTTNSSLVAATNSTTGFSFIDLINNGASGRNYQIGVGGNGAATGYANNLYFDLVGSGNIMTLTSGRNVGIGTASPSDTLHIAKNGASAYAAALWTNSNSTANLYVGVGGSGVGNAALQNNAYVLNAAASALVLGTSDTERMRITSGGVVAIGKTDGTFGNTGHALFQNGQVSHVVSNDAIMFLNRLGSNGEVAYFYRDSSAVGSISVTTTATSYNTSSDYRLKQNVKPVENALSVLTQLKPCTFNFIADADEEVMGFIAHEVQEVIPQAVTGEKDAVRIEQVEVSPAELDEEGNVITEAVIEEKEVPVYQGIDHSKLVPLLVASIQELKAEIEALKSQING